MRSTALALLSLGLAGCPPPAETAPPRQCAFDADCPVDELCESSSCEPCDVVLNLPAPNDPCLPKCGNELGVGQPCTPLGLECNHNGDIHALFCTVDNVPDASLSMCTGPCSEDSDCGSAAACVGDPEDPDSQKGCVPAGCTGEGEGEA